MSKILFNISVSLDGYVAGPNDEVDRIFQWYTSGDTEFRFPGPGLGFKVSRASADLLEEAARTVGAIVTGRRNFNLAGAWDGNPPLGVPHFVLTHSIPQEWVKPDSPFTFVTNGIASAIAQARQAAGDKDVALSSPSVMQQAYRAGLLDELHLDLVPIVLGAGVRLFERSGYAPRDLEIRRVTEGIGVTHLRYRVVK
jgi:dihydrofolate reductase